MNEELETETEIKAAAEAESTANESEEPTGEKQLYKVEVETPIGTMIFQVVIQDSDVEKAINKEIEWRMEKHGFSKWSLGKYTKRSLA